MRSCKSFVIMLVGLPGTAFAAAPATPAVAAERCEIRVWQSRDYASESPSTYAAYGLIGAIAQSAHDSRYPEGSTEKQMETELRQEVLEPVISAIPWASSTHSPTSEIHFASDAVSRDQIKALRAKSVRNSGSSSLCYVELYVDRQTFLGGMVQSNLMSEFTVRAFSGSRYLVANGKTFKKVKGFPAKDASTVETASASFRAAFVDNLGTFVAKKMKRPKG